MKAICIDDRFEEDGCNPHFGEIVTVIGVCPIHIANYDIAEYPVDANGKPQSFDKRAFAPLSSIDETTFERNYNKELI